MISSSYYAHVFSLPGELCWLWRTYFFLIQAGDIFFKSLVIKDYMIKFWKKYGIAKKMAAFFLHAPFWLKSLVTMLFSFLIRNQFWYTVVPDWTDFIHLATFQTFSSENSQTLKWCYCFIQIQFQLQVNLNYKASEKIPLPWIRKK